MQRQHRLHEDPSPPPRLPLPHHSPTIPFVHSPSFGFTWLVPSGSRQTFHFAGIRLLNNSSLLRFFRSFSPLPYTVRLFLFAFAFFPWFLSLTFTLVCFRSNSPNHSTPSHFVPPFLVLKPEDQPNFQIFPRRSYKAHVTTSFTTTIIPNFITYPNFKR